MTEHDFFGRLEVAAKDPGEFTSDVLTAINSDTKEYQIQTRFQLDEAIKSWNEDDIISIIKNVSRLVGPEQAIEYFNMVMEENTIGDDNF